MIASNILSSGQSTLNNCAGIALILILIFPPAIVLNVVFYINIYVSENNTQEKLDVLLQTTVEFFAEVPHNFQSQIFISS